MGKIIEPGFTGRVGNLIFYDLYGKKYVRTVPDRVKQTKATKARAGVFGIAARDSTELIFEYNNKPVAAQTISFKLTAPKGSLVLTGISLEYKIAKKGHLHTNKNRNYMPSEIVDARIV